MADAMVSPAVTKIQCSVGQDLSNGSLLTAQAVAIEVVTNGMSVSKTLTITGNDNFFAGNFSGCISETMSSVNDWIQKKVFYKSYLCQNCRRSQRSALGQPELKASA